MMLLLTLLPMAKLAVGSPLRANEIQPTVHKENALRNPAPVFCGNTTVLKGQAGASSRVPRGISGLAMKAEEIGDGGDIYTPFAGAGWQHNEVLSPAYPHTDDGLDTWPEMFEDGTGTLWAISTGTDNAYGNDTVYVFCSTDNGNTWLYRVAIYSDPANPPGYHPFVARLSVDRVNNWVYISNVLGSEAGGGSYYPGTMFVTRFHHDGGGAISSLGSYQCDPQGWGDIYGKCAVAPDGSGSAYTYLAGIDWSGGYMDYYRSADRGQTWTYITSLTLGTQYTDVISACPRYGSSGAIITWVDWDDASDADGNTPPEGDYDVYYGDVNSAGESWHYFNSGGSGFRGTLGPAAYGNSIVIGFEEEVSAFDFDAYFLATTDNGTTWTQYTHWNAGPAYDTRSPFFDVTPQAGGTFYMAYFEDGDGDHYGRPWFYWADVSDLSSWYSWPDADPDVRSDDPIYVNASEHWEIVSPGAQDTGGAWLAHVCWRSTVGATGGGDPWHSWPLPPVEVAEDASGGFFVGFTGRGISYVLPASSWLSLGVYDVSGRTVRALALEAPSRGEVSLEGLAPGAYLFRCETDFGTRTGSFVVR